MGVTPNFNLPLPDPSGIQKTEIQRVADALTALDAALKALSLAQAPDSALLEGKDLAFVTDVASRLGYSPLDKAGGEMSGQLSIKRPETATAGYTTFLSLTTSDYGNGIPNFGIQKDPAVDQWNVYVFDPADGETRLNFGATKLSRSGNQVWDAGNFNPASKLDVSAAYTKTMAAADISTAINNLMNGAPGALDTLNELAAALGDNPNFAATVSAQIGTKQDALGYTPLNKAGDTMSGSLTAPSLRATGHLQVDSYGGTAARGIIQVGASGTAYIDANAGGAFGLVGFSNAYVNGNGVWHAGNFTPGSKMNVSGGTFTGPIATSSGDITSGGNLLSNGGIVRAGSGAGTYVDINYNGYVNGNGTYGGKLHTSGQPAGDVGTYGIFKLVTAGTYGPGTPIAGSQMRWSDTSGDDDNASPPGSWRLMSYVNGAHPFIAMRYA